MLQLLYRTKHTAFIIAYIKLYNLFSGHATRILHGNRQRQRTVGSHDLGRSHRLAICKGSIAQAMTEGEERRNLLGVMPTITHQNVFLVLLLDAVTRITQFIESMCTAILQPGREREGQLAARIHRTTQDVSQRLAAHGA